MKRLILITQFRKLVAATWPSEGLVEFSVLRFQRLAPVLIEYESMRRSEFEPQIKKTNVHRTAAPSEAGGKNCCFLSKTTHVVFDILIFNALNFPKNGKQEKLRKSKYVESHSLMN